MTKNWWQLWVLLSVQSRIHIFDVCTPMFWWGPPITSIIFVPSHNEPLNGITSNVKKTHRKFIFTKKAKKNCKNHLQTVKNYRKYQDLKIFRWILDKIDFFIACETVVKTETGSRLQCHTQNFKVHHLFKSSRFNEIWFNPYDAFVILKIGQFFAEILLNSG